MNAVNNIIAVVFTKRTVCTPVEKLLQYTASRVSIAVVLLERTTGTSEGDARALVEGVSPSTHRLRVCKD